MMSDFRGDGGSSKIGQNRIRGGWGVKKTQKTSDIIYVRSLILSRDAAGFSNPGGLVVMWWA